MPLIKRRASGQKTRKRFLSRGGSCLAGTCASVQIATQPGVNELLERQEKVVNLPKLKGYVEKYSEKEIEESLVRIPHPDKNFVLNAIRRAIIGTDTEGLKKIIEPWCANTLLNEYYGTEMFKTDTLLMFASYKGFIDGVKIFIAQPGIEVNKGNSYDGSTVLHSASAMGHVEIVELLCSLPDIDVNIKNKQEQTPYQIACDGYKGEDATYRKGLIQKILEDKGASKGGKKNKSRKTRKNKRK